MKFYEKFLFKKMFFCFRVKYIKQGILISPCHFKIKNNHTIVFQMMYSEYLVTANQCRNIFSAFKYQKLIKCLTFKNKLAFKYHIFQKSLFESDLIRKKKKEISSRSCQQVRKTHILEH